MDNVQVTTNEKTNNSTNSLLSNFEQSRLKILEQNNSLKLLLDKVKNMEQSTAAAEAYAAKWKNEYEQMGADIRRIVAESEEKSKLIAMQEEQMTLMESQLGEYSRRLAERQQANILAEQEVVRQKLEIERLKGIKWHQKLLGAK